VWTARGIPDDPGAWLYRVAHNNLIDGLRRNADRLRILAQAVEAVDQRDHPPPPHFTNEMADDTLRMLLHTMNRAVAVAEWQGPDAGLALLEALAPPAWLAGSYLCEIHLAINVAIEHTRARRLRRAPSTSRCTRHLPAALQA
jgi:predicted RNA polymerase sigma factor